MGLKALFYSCMDKNSAKVSVVVPVYNVGAYLKQCVLSLCAQTYQNIEILLIDDGSTDCSGHLADELQKKDKRIKVYHVENGGVTSARKLGWTYSTGLYCLFVDADDFLSPDAVEYFVNIFDGLDCDFVSGWYDIVYENGDIAEVKCPFKVGRFPVREYIQMSIQEINDFSSIWIGMYKRSVLSDDVFDIDRSIIRGEDATTLIGALNRMQNIFVSNKVFYHYFQRLDSVTHTKRIDWNYIVSLKELQYNRIDVSYRDLFLPLLIKTLMNSFFYVDNSYKKIYLNRLRELFSQSVYHNLNIKSKIKWYCIKNPILRVLVNFMLNVINRDDGKAAE